MFNAIRKLIFCYKITTTLPSFLRLVWNTKRYRWSKGKQMNPRHTEELSKYSVSISGKKQSIYLRTFAGDLDIFYEVFLEKAYRQISPTNSGEKVIVDLGAHVGLAALYFITNDPTARLFCIEPDPENFRLLSVNLAPLISRGTARIFNAAAMPEDGEVFIESGLKKYNSKITADISGVTVKAIGINNLVKSACISEINIMKIDIEGAEKLLFSKNTEWLSLTENIILEFHSEEDQNIVSQKLNEERFTVNILPSPSLSHMLTATKKV